MDTRAADLHRRMPAAGDASMAAAPSLLDEAAFNALYQRTAAPLRGYAARVLGNLSIADDIVQETYLRVLRHRVPARDPEALRAYVFTVASRLMTDHFRRLQRQNRMLDAPPAATIASDASLAIDMARMFARLRPRDRQLLWLAHVEGAGHREIAGMLGLGERSVRVLLFRARRRLAALLEKGGHAPETR